MNGRQLLIEFISFSSAAGASDIWSERMKIVDYSILHILFNVPQSTQVLKSRNSALHLQKREKALNVAKRVISSSSRMHKEEFPLTIAMENMDEIRTQVSKLYADDQMDDSNFPKASDFDYVLSGMWDSIGEMNYSTSMYCYLCYYRYFNRLVSEAVDRIDLPIEILKIIESVKLDVKIAVVAEFTENQNIASALVPFIVDYYGDPSAEVENRLLIKKLLES